MHFFRLGLPKRFLTDADANEVIKVAAKFKTNEKRLAKYETEYLQAKEAEEMARDPVAVLKKQNEDLVSERMRLEAETENLAREMVLQKVRESLSLR